MELVQRNNSDALMQQIIRSNTTCLKYGRVSAKEIFNFIWNNHDHSPQEVFDIFGDAAVKELSVLDILQNLISIIDPEYNILIPKYDYVKNGDGTVTVGSLKVLDV